MEEFKSFYKTVEGGEGEHCHYPTRLDVYGCGCYHNCNYCYARALLDFRGLWHPEEPAVADLKKVKAVLDTIEPGTVVRLGGMTDCFQPAEVETEAAYQTLRMMMHRGIHALIVTKSDLIASPKYMEVLDPKLAHIQVSVTSTDPEISQRVLGERAPAPERRFKAIESLSEAGFDVSMRLSPLIPEFVDFDRLNAVKVDKAIVEFLRVNTWIRRWLKIDYRPYSHKEGGYRHLPRPAKQRILKRLTIPQISVCEDCNSHYDFWRQWVNPNPEDCCNLRL